MSQKRATVVYHLVPTSNHNFKGLSNDVTLLFIILFLHQTTTDIRAYMKRLRCLSSCSYIKPQREGCEDGRGWCCLSSCSYIKPQLDLRNNVWS